MNKAIAAALLSVVMYFSFISACRAQTEKEQEAIAKELSRPFKALEWQVMKAPLNLSFSAPKPIREPATEAKVVRNWMAVGADTAFQVITVEKTSRPEELKQNLDAFVGGLLQGNKEAMIRSTGAGEVTQKTLKEGTVNGMYMREISLTAKSGKYEKHGLARFYIGVDGLRGALVLSPSETSPAITKFFESFVP